MVEPGSPGSSMPSPAHPETPASASSAASPSRKRSSKNKRSPKSATEEDESYADDDFEEEGEMYSDDKFEEYDEEESRLVGSASQKASTERAEESVSCAQETSQILTASAEVDDRGGFDAKASAKDVLDASLESMLNGGGEEDPSEPQYAIETSSAATGEIQTFEALEASVNSLLHDDELMKAEGQVLNAPEEPPLCGVGGAEAYEENDEAKRKARDALEPPLFNGDGDPECEEGDKHEEQEMAEATNGVPQRFSLIAQRFSLFNEGQAKRQDGDGDRPEDREEVKRRAQNALAMLLLNAENDAEADQSEAEVISQEMLGKSVFASEGDDRNTDFENQGGEEAGSERAKEKARHALEKSLFDGEGEEEDEQEDAKRKAREALEKSVLDGEGEEEAGQEDAKRKAREALENSLFDGEGEEESGQEDAKRKAREALENSLFDGEGEEEAGQEEAKRKAREALEKSLFNGEKTEEDASISCSTAPRSIPCDGQGRAGHTNDVEHILQHSSEQEEKAREEARRKARDALEKSVFDSLGQEAGDPADIIIVDDPIGSKGAEKLAAPLQAKQKADETKTGQGKQSKRAGAMRGPAARALLRQPERCASAPGRARRPASQGSMRPISSGSSQRSLSAAGKMYQSSPPFQWPSITSDGHPAPPLGPAQPFRNWDERHHLNGSENELKPKDMRDYFSAPKTLEEVKKELMKKNHMGKALKRLGSPEPSRPSSPLTCDASPTICPGRHKIDGTMQDRDGQSRCWNNRWHKSSSEFNEHLHPSHRRCFAQGSVYDTSPSNSWRRYMHYETEPGSWCSIDTKRPPLFGPMGV